MASRGCVCFVGNLPGDVREREIEDLFYKYGRIRNIDLKLPPRPPAFAFVEFENPRDAEDAVRGRDGYDFDGQSIRVELSRGGMGGRGMIMSGGSGSSRRDEDAELSGRDKPSRRDDYGSRGGGSYGGSSAPIGRGPPPVAPPNFRSKGSAYRVLVKGLPMSASWQDLKDHFRKVCTPNYVNVFRDRGGVIGVVEFDTPEDLARAVRKLDDTEFRNPFERAYVRVYDDSDSKKARGRSRSRDSRSYSRSRSRSPSNSRSRSRSRSASDSRSRSRSSRSASPRSDRSDDKDRDGDKDDKRDADEDDAPDKEEDAPKEAAVAAKEEDDEPMADGEDKADGDSPAEAAHGMDHKDKDVKAADEDDD